MEGGPSRSPSASLTVAGYQPALDGLRALAITAVVVFHSAPNLLPGGWWGVDLFFVLSGFLITSLLMQETDRFGSIKRLAFYARRALRLWPAFALVLLFCTAIALGSKNPKNGLESVAMSGLYVMNWNRAYAWFPDVGLGHTWSLAMEEQFYLVWPFLLTIFLPRRPLAWTLGLIAAVLALRVAMLSAGASTERIMNGFDTHSDGLLIGAALAIVNIRHPKAVPWLAKGALVIAPIAIILLAVPVETKYVDSFGLTIVAIVSASLVVLGMTSRIAGGILSLGFLRYTGKISYGWYLWHMPVLSLGVHHLKGGLPLVSALAVASYSIAALSYHFVERPILRLKARFSPLSREQHLPDGDPASNDRLPHAVAAMQTIARPARPAVQRP